MRSTKTVATTHNAHKFVAIVKQHFVVNTQDTSVIKRTCFKLGIDQRDSGAIVYWNSMGYLSYLKLYFLFNEM